MATYPKTRWGVELRKRTEIANAIQRKGRGHYTHAIKQAAAFIRQIRGQRRARMYSDHLARYACKTFDGAVAVARAEKGGAR